MMTELPWIRSRPKKPRASGRTQILDKGLGIRALEDLVETASDHIDLVKFGWGTAAVTAGLAPKVDAYHAAGIEVCLGGTLLEYAWATGAVDEYERFVAELGIRHVEVSDGTIEIPTEEKLALIERFSGRFEVSSEVGSKDASVVVTPAKWVAAIHRELDAGAKRVILEGRESGTSGMYRTSGEIRMGLIDEILDDGIPPEKLLFEAPTKDGQVWFIRQIGPEVNLANIRPEDAISVETLRRGLRADTLRHFLK